MNLKNIIIAITSMLFLLIGADKFLMFLESSCSLMDAIPSMIWNLIGVLQIAAGIGIWFPKFRRYVVGFFFVFMLMFTAVHILQDTYDVGGSIFMAILLGVLIWDPAFINSAKTNQLK